MCGIIGVIHPHHDVTDRIFTGLQRLQYRGYDSAGVGLRTKDNNVQIYRTLGTLESLQGVYQENPTIGDQGFGHTRWATHGKPCVKNAHPHTFGGVSMIHNGIFRHIETLKDQYPGSPQGETDTEKALLIISHILQSVDYDFQALGPKLESLFTGHFAFIIMDERQPHKFFVSCRGCNPLVLGKKDGAVYISSDLYGLGSWVDDITSLEDGDWGVVDSDGWSLYNQGHQVSRPSRKQGQHSIATLTPDPYEHFLMQEIHQQPAVWKNLWQNRESYRWEHAPESLHIFGCGSAYYAGRLGQSFFHNWMKLPTVCHIPSEFSAFPAVLSPRACSLFISQSGETLDLLDVLPDIQAQTSETMALVNVPHSALDRRVHKRFYTHAGVEQSVASTKAWSAQVLVLMMLAFHGARAKGFLQDPWENAFENLDIAFEKTVLAMKDWESKPWIPQAHHLLILGRGPGYALAQEGSLKINEIAYLPTQALPAGEIKHGPLALLEKGVSVLCLCPKDHVFEKNVSTIQELSSRGGDLWVLTDALGAKEIPLPPSRMAILPDYHPVTFPLTYGVALQRLAYHLGVQKNRPIDLPRHLAKSVTVE